MEPYLNHPPKPDRNLYVPKPPPPMEPYHHAILIPYRNRTYHLQQFIDFMHPYLQHHFPDHSFTLWVIEQADQDLFNRGWLTNVGLQEIRKAAPQTNCVILHDVDLIPNSTDVFVPYTNCSFPMHLSKQMQTWDWTVPYNRYCGGIMSLSLQHWTTINGMSNDYVGWGGEDDDLWHRLRINGLVLHPDPKAHPVPQRPNDGEGIFRAISQSEEHHAQVKDHDNKPKIQGLLEAMWRNDDRWQTEGLNNFYYSLMDTQVTKPKTRRKPTTKKKNTTKKATGGFKTIRKVRALAKRAVDQSTIKDTIPKEFQNQSKSLPVLEFLDIPYSGGEIVTRMAARSNIVWGACHYGNYSQFDCHRANHTGDWKYEGVVNDKTYQQSQKPWHLMFQEWKHSPLEGASRFVVVRNPYQRAIEFYRTWSDHWNTTEKTRDHPLPYYLKKRENPNELNAFLQLYLRQDELSWKPKPFMRGVLDLMPQFDTTGLRKNRTEGRLGEYNWVQHVLRFEHLKEDFEHLLELYPHYKIKEKDLALLTVGTAEAEEKQFSGTLRSSDLTAETITFLNDVYKLDFKYWNYTKLEGKKKPGTKTLIHPRKKGHVLSVKDVSMLEFVPIPFTGVSKEITRAGSRGGLVWAACHFYQFEEYECLPESGDLGDSLQFSLVPEQAQEPWHYPISTWSRNPYDKTKTFSVVTNPYTRALTFYRRMYDTQHDFPNGFKAEVGRKVKDYMAAREDRETMNRWLQEYFTTHHHPRRPDGMYLIPQFKYTSKLNYMPKFEKLRDSLHKMFGRIRRHPLPDALKLELLAAAEALSNQPPPKSNWLQIPDLSDVTVAMINEIYHVDFYKFYPGLKLKTNVTTAAHWEKIIPIPSIKTSKPKLAGTPPNIQPGTGRLAKPLSHKGAPNPATGPLSALEAYTNRKKETAPTTTIVGGKLQKQSEAIQAASARIQEYRERKKKATAPATTTTTTTNASPFAVSAKRIPKNKPPKRKARKGQTT